LTAAITKSMRDCLFTTTTTTTLNNRVALRCVALRCVVALAEKGMRNTKFTAYDEIDKAPEEKKRGITISYVACSSMHVA
jgi:hypothetical protein